MTILEKIVNHKKTEVEKQKMNITLSQLSEEGIATDSWQSLRKKINIEKRFHLICEVKKASPSKGIIRADFDPLKIAVKYEQGGASAVSVLTDEHFFMGKLDYIPLIKKMVKIPILRKDFIIDRYQIYESKYWQADVILLIARILSKKQLTDFTQLAKRLELDVMIEIADETDISKLPAFEDNMILGINNRNLETFEVDFEQSFRLKNILADGVPVIAESGIKTVLDCRRLQEGGFQGALIGETLMKSSEPQQLIKLFIQGTQDVGQT
jgi:indole-3-glycerol phosphate synthase